LEYAVIMLELMNARHLPSIFTFYGAKNHYFWG